MKNEDRFDRIARRVGGFCLTVTALSLLAVLFGAGFSSTEIGRATLLIGAYGVIGVLTLIFCTGVGIVIALMLVSGLEMMGVLKS